VASIVPIRLHRVKVEALDIEDGAEQSSLAHVAERTRHSTRGETSLNPAVGHDPGKIARDCERDAARSGLE